MFESNVENMCSSLRSKSLFNPEKVQGSTMQTPIKSGDFPSLPLMLHRSQPGSIHSHTQLPRDAPHRSTHQTLTPSSPIWLRLRRSNVRVLLTHNASAKAWKRWKAERQANDPWQKHKPKIPSKAFRQYYQSGQSDKAAHRFGKHCEKTTIADSKTRSKMRTPFVGPWEKKLADPQKRFRIAFCVWARSNSKLRGLYILYVI